MINSKHKLMNKHPKKVLKTSGFTLVEIMVSVSIFAIIMVTGIGALLSITRAYQASRNEANTTNALHFTFDSMVRDIRIGDAYFAGDFTPRTSFGTEYRNNDGQQNILNLMGAPVRGHIEYAWTGTPRRLERYRSENVTSVGETYELLGEFDDVSIDQGIFRVVGSDPTDNLQPSVFIYVRGTDDVSGSEFVLQTFVSQRSPDF